MIDIVLYGLSFGLFLLYMTTILVLFLLAAFFALVGIPITCIITSMVIHDLTSKWIARAKKAL